MARFRKIIALILSITILTGTCNISAYANEDNATSQSGVAEETSGWDGVTTETTYTGEDYKVIFTLTGHWSGGYNASVTIENTSDSAIHNWYLAYDSIYEISNIWNGEIYHTTENSTIIKNAGWNQDILVGGSVSFGFTGTGEFTGFPTKYDIVTKSRETSAEDYKVIYTLNSDWDSGYSATITITNNTDRTLEDWILEIDYDRDITNIWNGAIESSAENHYIIRNAGYNSNISAGQSVTFGFTGTNGSREDTPLNCRLFTYEVAKKQSDETEETKETEYVQLADGLIDKTYLEEAIYPQLRRNGLSTDDVRLSDDFDGDGLTLIQEYDYNTNPFAVDSDEDTLSDWDEINIYGTSPINHDTDNDGISDGTEVVNGLDPLAADTDGDGIIDGDETMTQQVRLDSVKTYELETVGTLPLLELTGKGDYSQEIYAEAIEYDETILDLECLVGTAYDFVHDEDLKFDSGKLTFEISDETLEKYDIEDLVIAWYNEEENALELLETSYDEVNNTVSAEVEHFSIYMVVSSVEYYRNIGDANGGCVIGSGRADIVFVIDTTSSNETEIESIRENLSRFINVLSLNQVDLRYAFIEYRNLEKDLENVNPSATYNWYTGYSDFKNHLSLLGTRGEEDVARSVVEALNCAATMSYRAGVERNVILITGSDCDIETIFDEAISKFVKRDISVSVVTDEDYYGTYDVLTYKTDGVMADINGDFSYGLSPIVLKIGVGTGLRYRNGYRCRLLARNAKWNVWQVFRNTGFRLLDKTVKRSDGQA